MPSCILQALLVLLLVSVDMVVEVASAWVDNMVLEVLAVVAAEFVVAVLAGGFADRGIDRGKVDNRLVEAVVDNTSFFSKTYTTSTWLSSLSLFSVLVFWLMLLVFSSKPLSLSYTFLALARSSMDMLSTGSSSTSYMLDLLATDMDMGTREDRVGRGMGSSFPYHLHHGYGG